MSKIISTFVNKLKINKFKRQNKMEVTNKQEALNKLNELKVEFDKKTRELQCAIESFDKCKGFSYEDVKNINIAEEVLKDCCKDEHIQYFENQFIRKRDWVAYKLETMIKAVNFIANGNKIWLKNWGNSNEYYYTPYFDMRNGSFSYNNCNYWNGDSGVGFGWGFKNKELMLHGVKYWLDDYRFYHTGK